MQKFDVIVLGGGPGGYPAAIRGAQLGLSVALVERGELGGTCLNRGCIPSKTLIAGADFTSRLKDSSTFGISLEKWHFDYAALAKHKDEVVAKMRRGVEGLIAANKITLFKGFGTLISPTQISVKGKETVILEGKKLILATGSEPRALDAFPFDFEKIHDSTSLLEIKEAPKSLIIIGGGVIGCEFASLFANLGTKVTLIEVLPRILSTESEEISEALTRSFKKRGIEVLVSTKVKALHKEKNEVFVTLENEEKRSAESSLISVGRTLNTKGIGLEQVGINLNPNGTVKVNSYMETSVKNIYAVGDIASKWWLAHVATHQGVIAAENAAGKRRQMDERAIPSVVFTKPEIGSVGLSLAKALEKGIKAKKAVFPFSALGKAVACLETEGFVQITYETDTKEILGAEAFGFEASTLISEMAVAITNELTLESISETIHPHPTFGEAWGEVATLAEGYPLSLPPSKPRAP